MVAEMGMEWFEVWYTTTLTWAWAFYEGADPAGLACGDRHGMTTISFLPASSNTNEILITIAVSRILLESVNRPAIWP